MLTHKTMFLQLGGQSDHFCLVLFAGQGFLYTWSTHQFQVLFGITFVLKPQTYFLLHPVYEQISVFYIVGIFPMGMQNWRVKYKQMLHGNIVTHSYSNKIYPAGIHILTPVRHSLVKESCLTLQSYDFITNLTRELRE